MSDPLLDELNTTTIKEMWPLVLQDNFFKNAPFLAYLRNSKSFAPFEGGAYTQNTFAFAGTIGGFYTQGATFNLNKPQLLANTNFQMKTVEDNVTEYLEEISIYNRGKNAVFSLIDTHLALAMNTINARINIASWRHGQASGTNISDDRTAFINGLDEALNDGVSAGWNGNTYATYGGAGRTNSIYNNALNSVPYFVGSSSGGAAGQITYNILLEQYLQCRRGNESPNLLVMNKAAFAYVLEKIQPQQRFANIELQKDVVWGADGFKFMSAMCLVDDYAPSATAQYGVNDANLGNYSTSTAVTALAGAASASNQPTTGTFNAAEVIFILNTDKWLFRVSSDPLFQFGFTGFKGTADSTRVAGQVLAGCNLECVAPWSGKILMGING